MPAILVPLNMKCTNKPWWRFWDTKEESKHRRFNAGFKWAAGQLLTGDNPDSIKGFIACSRDFGNYDDFDKGAERALERFDQIRKP